jgi:hypothetical protein
VVATSGTSYAAVSLPTNSVGSRQLRRGAVTLTKINPSARRALHGETGKTGKMGSSGTALAYAHVLANGTLDTARSRNVAAVSKPIPQQGIYCFSLNFTPSNAVATLENAATPPNVPPDAFLYVNVGTAAQACPAGSQAGVVMRGPNDETITGGSFFIVFN